MTKRRGIPRLRGSDFYMRLSQGQWSEAQIIEAVNTTPHFIAIQYGLSQVAPKDREELEAYFRAAEATATHGKRPDLLVFRREDHRALTGDSKLGPLLSNLPWTPDIAADAVAQRALLGVECENSLWKAKKMPGYVRGPVRLRSGKLGFKKADILPNIMVKDEDLAGLTAWERYFRLPLYVTHVFFDLAFMIEFRRALALIKDGTIQPKVRYFSSPGGKTVEKRTYDFWYSLAIPFGSLLEETKLNAATVEDPNGHIYPYVTFEGGKLRMTDEAIAQWLALT